MTELQKVECLECRFCHGLVGTEAGEVGKLERHLVDTHDILLNRQLSLATFFITTEEVATILASLESRINLFKTKGLLDLQNNVLEKKDNLSPKMSDDGDSGCEIEEGEDKQLSESIERQQQEILKLLDSDDEGDDDVNDATIKPTAATTEKVNGLEKIRRRVFSTSSEQSRYGSRELEQQLAATTTLTDRSDTASPLERAGTERREASYFDFQRRKIERMLLSDDDSSESEQDNSVEKVRGGDMQHNEEQSRSIKRKSTNTWYICTSDDLPPVNVKEEIPESPTESSLSLLLHATVNDMSPGHLSEDIKSSNRVNNFPDPPAPKVAPDDPENVGQETTSLEKKHRVRFSDEQVLKLKQLYEDNKKPSREEIMSIAETFGQPFKSVDKWFRNSRARDSRGGNMATPSSSIKSDPDPAPNYPLVPASADIKDDLEEKTSLEEKTRRFRFSDEEVLKLKQFYEKNKRPSRKEIVNIAEAVGQPHKSVKRWFETSRTKDRREGRLETSLSKQEEDAVLGPALLPVILSSTLDHVNQVKEPENISKKSPSPSLSHPPVMVDMVEKEGDQIVPGDDNLREERYAKKANEEHTIAKQQINNVNIEMNGWVEQMYPNDAEAEGEVEVDPLAIAPVEFVNEGEDKQDKEETKENKEVPQLREKKKATHQNVADKFKGQYDEVNLVEQFKARNYCRLCYENPGRKEEDLRRHEQEAHPDEKESLARDFFSVTDLVFRCDLCPHIPGYLTENLLNQHGAKEHKYR